MIRMDGYCQLGGDGGDVTAHGLEENDGCMADAAAGARDQHTLALAQPPARHGGMEDGAKLGAVFVRLATAYRTTITKMINNNSPPTVHMTAEASRGSQPAGTGTKAPSLATRYSA